MTDSSLAIVSNVPHLPPRAVDANKGTFGKVMVVAGSLGMSGAAVLSGSGALRGGAGLVQVATPERVVAIVAAGNPCYMTLPQPADAVGRLSRTALTGLLEHAAAASAVVVGPGLGQSDEIASVVHTLVEKVGSPMVLDADGLNVLGAGPAVLRQRQAPIVLTPHPGEFGRLIGKHAHDVKANRQALAVEFARAFGVVLILKGAGTIVTDGVRVYVNTTGNPGMATGGSGDVLSGLVGALLAQGLEAFSAAVLGVYVHGLAGDLARAERGETGMIASDLLAYLPPAFARHALSR